MTTFLRQSADAIAREVRAGRSAVEVCEAALSRADAYEAVQGSIWISREPAADVLDQAREVDRRVRAGAFLPLAGVPFAVKDNIDVAGRPTTAACPAFAYEAGASAPVVARLLGAGAILVGKTNLDQFATGLVGVRSPYGACGSAYNRRYISGGSSSGSAVAVAAGLVAFALGTDTAGSGRVPAALNHLVGLKPTRGRWSTRGVVPACRSLDCVSVFCSDVADALLIDEVVAAFDADDPFSRTEPADPAPSPAGLRLGVPSPDQVDWGADGQGRRLFEAAVRRAEAIGARTVEVDIAPLVEAGQLLYGGPWVAERTASAETLLLTNPAAIHPVVRTILESGRSISAVQAFRGYYRLKGLQRRAKVLWREADALLLPTVVGTFRIAEVEAEPFALNARLGAYTNFVNLLDMAAVALPAGFRDNATAFGVSLVGPAFSDRRLLELARRWEETQTLAPPPPLDLAAVGAKVRLAVVGAHLAGMPLHWQLASRGARLARRCRTARAYRLYAIAGASPPKPALVHVGDGGAEIEVEVYELGIEPFGAFVAEVPAPLAIGTVTLEDGEEVKGFVAEPRALAGAADITGFGGWRAYVESRSTSA